MLLGHESRQTNTEYSVTIAINLKEGEEKRVHHKCLKQKPHIYIKCNCTGKILYRQFKHLSLNRILYF